MSVRTDAPHYQLSHLRTLEAEAIHIFREVAAEFERPVLLFSGGKDSAVMLHVARKAFWPCPLPFPVMHIDTGHNFDEVLAFRDQEVARHEQVGQIGCTGVGDAFGSPIDHHQAGGGPLGCRVLRDQLERKIEIEIRDAHHPIVPDPGGRPGDDVSGR